MTVRAKFKVEKVERTTSGSTVHLQPVTSGSAENDNFFRWTPFGRIEMGIVNPDAAERFEPGDAFYVDFTPAD